jgi:accessory gene regulator B
MIIYSPADTEKRPLINKKKRIVYKVVTIIISIIYISIIFIKKDIYLSKILFFSIFLETLLVLPISYKLLGLKYNNYKRYKKGGTK